MTDRYPARQRQRTPLRRWPAPCRHLCGKLARRHARWPHLATEYCSDRCKVNNQAQRARQRQRELAEGIRKMLGLPGGRGPTFTLPELEAIDRRLRRVLPYEGMAMHPARTASGRKRSTTLRSSRQGVISC